MSGGTTK